MWILRPPPLGFPASRTPFTQGIPTSPPSVTPELRLPSVEAPPGVLPLVIDKPEIPTDHDVALGNIDDLLKLNIIDLFQ